MIFFLIMIQSFGCGFIDYKERLNNNRYSRDELVLYQIYSSENENNTICSAVKLYDEPEIYIGEEDVVRMTDNEFIEFDPVINNNGDYAYALSEYSVDSSKIYLNGNLIERTDDGCLYKNLEINNKYLIYSCETEDRQGNFISLYDLENKTVKNMEIGMHIQNMKFIDENRILIQGWSPETLSMDIYIYNMKNNEIEKLFNSKSDEIIKDVNYEDRFKIDVISGDSDAKYLFNALYKLCDCGMTEPFSSSNNFMGRISWNQSYRLESLLKLYELFGDSQTKDRINSVVINLMKVQNKNLGIDDKYNPDFLYASKKYSLDKKTPISMMVDNSRIYYPLLLAVNMDLIEDKVLSERIIKSTEEMFDFFEAYYNKHERLYHFQYGSDFWADGLWVPYNQQNMFGLVLIELYKATNKSVYRERVYELAEKFVSGFEYTDNRNLIWHYWPEEFYLGWDKEDNLSSNTPFREPYDDRLYEDVNHAGLNVKFMIEFHEAFNGEIITGEVMNEVNSILSNLVKDRSFPCYISGDIENVKPNIKYIPGYGWSELGNITLDGIYYNLIPNINPDFDGEEILCYLDAMDDFSDTKLLEVETHEFNCRQEIFEAMVNSYNYSFKNITDYFSN